MTLYHCTGSPLRPPSPLFLATVWPTSLLLECQPLRLFPQGCEIKTDYGPLLHTLAEFGWLLTSVLPTPILRHDR